MIDPIDLSRIRQGLVTSQQLSAAVAVKSYTLATLPSASNFANGTTVLVTDLGASPGSFLFSDGVSSWIPRTNLPSFTWSSKPLANSLPSGTAIRVSDVGVSPGMRCVTDGTFWRPDGVLVLGRSAVPISITGTTTQATLATIPVPASILGLSGGIRITTTLSMTNSANGKIVQHSISGTAVYITTLTNCLSANLQSVTRNRSSASSQVSNASSTSIYGTSAASVVTTSIDTSVAQSLTITGRLTNSSEVLTLESYCVEMLP